MALMPDEIEIPLPGGTVNGEVVRVGDTVRRNTGPWTPAVHALLRHLEGAGFPYSSRVLGIDAKGREVLSYIEGVTGNMPWPAALFTDAAVRDVATLVRQYHDAVAGFVPPPGSVWRNTDRPLAPGEIVRHGDLGTWNMIWREGELVGLIDWDFAEPGPAIIDAAYAAKHIVPLRADAALQQIGWQTTPDRKHRLRLFCEEYGSVTPQQLLDAVDAYNELSAKRMRTRGGAGEHPWAGFLEGYMGDLQEDIAWFAEHKASLC
jgi:Phosphotransferase enzyme family